FGPFTISGTPGTAQAPVAYAPRRTVLDQLLVDAASAAGAEVREGFTVTDLVVQDGRVRGVRGHGRHGRTLTEGARVVIGADGRHSRVARGVGPAQYHQQPPLLCGYYSYWSGLPMEGRFETWIRPGRAFAAWPTHDELTLVIGGWPYAERDANRGDIEGNFLKLLALAPAFADRVRAAVREARFVGTAVANYFRKPYGPGWALVGDAGYNKDFITAQGMQDAFRDAELCATALDQWFRGASPFEAAMAGYQATRDSQVLAMYEFTTQLATLAPPPPDLQQLLGAIHGNQEAMDGFARVMAGVTSPTDFFSEQNIGRITSPAAAHP
ncbi:MAG TPA: FAD-dependent monooxygenase, partial [Actinomycetota bacterium]|nr:FAD-dependent monooxygenase [Actinomycetota bacterium]